MGLQRPSLDVSQPFKYKTGNLLVAEGGDFYHTMKVTATMPERPATGSVWYPVDMPELMTASNDPDETISPSEGGKVVTAWLNSSMGFIPFFGYRAEVRGARGKYKTKQLRRVSSLNPSKLTREQIDSMIGAYEDVKDTEWSLMRNQLEDAIDDPSHPRRRLDKKVCDALLDEEVDPEIVELEKDLKREINRLGRIMNG